MATTTGVHAIQLTVLTSNGKALPQVNQSTGLVKTGFPNAGNANYEIFVVDRIQSIKANQNPTTKTYPLQLAGSSQFSYLRGYDSSLSDTFTVAESMATILAMF